MELKEAHGVEDLVYHCHRIHSMELKAKGRTPRPPPTGKHRNPFNGIERLVKSTSLSACMCKNPFNGIESIAHLILHRCPPLILNPFNGIESYPICRISLTLLSLGESIQWN